MPINMYGEWNDGILDMYGRKVSNNIDEVGNIVFGTPVVSSAPLPSIISVDNDVISAKSGKNECHVVFTFDQDVTAWEVRVLGAGQGTGTLADSGGAVTQGTQITATIDSTELSIEGENRVNIYGQNSGGTWTIYNS